MDRLFYRTHFSIDRLLKFVILDIDLDESNTESEQPTFVKFEL